MRSKFLLLSLIFWFTLLFFLIHPQVSLAAISVETLDVSAGKTSAILNATATSDETYDIRGFNLGTASAAGGNYNLATSTETGGPWIGAEISFSTSTTDTWGSLTKGKCYYVRAYVSSSTDPTRLTYGNEKKFITGIDQPTGLTVSPTANSISLSWTKGEGAQNTIIRYRTDKYPTSITDGTLACKDGDTTCTPLVGLRCGDPTVYYFRAWSSTTDGGLSTTSEAYASVKGSVTACPFGVRKPPKVSADSLVINQGAEITESREVELTLKAEFVTSMIICNNLEFLGCVLEPYQSTKSWILSEGEGEKIVYGMFISPDGINSVIVSDSIILEIPEIVEEKVPQEVPEEVPEEVVEEKVVQELTPVEQLRAKIVELQKKIIKLLNQVIQLIQQQLTELQSESVLRE